MVVRCIVALTVTGTPQVPLIIGGTTRYADYVPALSGASVLVFSYTVQKTDYDNDGIQYNGPTPWRMNGGSVVLRGHKTTATILPASYMTDWIYINSDEGYVPAKVNGGGSGTGSGGVTPNRPAAPLVTSVEFYSSPRYESTYRLDEQIRVHVRFSDPVTVTGTPQLGLTIGTQTRQATYHADESIYADEEFGLSPGSILGLTYTVQASDLALDGSGIAANALSLNGGTISRASDSTTAASLRHAAVATDSTRKVDGSKSGANPDGGGNPGTGLRVNTVRLTGTPASGTTYRLGEQIEVAVTFTNAVTVTGTPQLGLTIGTQTRQAVYDATQSKGTLVVFSYSVQATDADADGISIAANVLTLNGGTIILASDSTTAASLAHAGVGTDDTRKVDGSTDVVEHGNSREQATLLTLTARSTGEVGETGYGEARQIGMATERGAEVAGALEAAGDVDYFRVEVAGAGTLTGETTGRTDTVGALEGAVGQALTADGDGGTEPNFRVERLVQAGTYYIKVEGAVAGEGAAARQATGAYTLVVRFTPARGGTTVGSVVPPPVESPPADGGAPANGEGSRPARLRLNAETAGTLQQAGEADYFRVEVEEAGTVMVEASGAAAPAAYSGAGGGPLLPQRAAGEGDRVVQAGWPVTAGTYHVAVVGGATRTQTGAYTVAVHFTAASEAGPLRATLLNVAPAHAWVHFYCGRAQDSEAAACTAQLQCGQPDGGPIAWDVEVAPETIFTYWPGRTAADGTPADFVAALIGAGRTEAEARRRTTCQVFSTDPVDVRGYTQVGGAVVPVANPPVVPAADAPTRIGTLLNLSPAQAWVHFYCRKVHQPDAGTVDPCTVRLQCGQRDGPSVAWDVDIAPETILSYWPGRPASDGIPGNLAAALVAAGKTEAEARRRTTCQVFSADPVDVRGYTRLGETTIPVKN